MRLTWPPWTTPRQRLATGLEKPGRPTSSPSRLDPPGPTLSSPQHAQGPHGEAHLVLLLPAQPRLNPGTDANPHPSMAVGSGWCSIWPPPWSTWPRRSRAIAWPSPTSPQAPRLPWCCKPAQAATEQWPSHWQSTRSAGPALADRNTRRCAIRPASGPDPPRHRRLAGAGGLGHGGRVGLRVLPATICGALICVSNRPNWPPSCTTPAMRSSATTSTARS